MIIATSVAPGATLMLAAALVARRPHGRRNQHRVREPVTATGEHDHGCQSDLRTGAGAAQAEDPCLGG